MFDVTDSKMVSNVNSLYSLFLPLTQYYMIGQHYTVQWDKACIPHSQDPLSFLQRVAGLQNQLKIVGLTMMKNLVAISQ